MRWCSALLISAALCGCQTSPHNELIEAELRARDADLREMRSELDRTSAYNDYLNRELKHLQHLGPASAPVAEGALVSGSRLRAITLGRQTGGFEEDAVPGDEALQVVVEPRDVDNHVVKAPGNVQIYALEVTDQGVKKPLSGWHVDGEELRKSWRSGILSTGYHLVLPWKSWPTTCKLRVVVRFVSEEERLFEADRDLTIRIPPSTLRPMLPAAPPAPPPSLQPREPDLPLPKKVEPGSDESKEENKDEKKEEEKPDPDRPLKGAVEMLKPVPRIDPE